MTLDDACSAFETLFKTVKVDPGYGEGSAIVCSAAIGMPDQPPPVLCATEAVAIDLWSRCARDYTAATIKDCANATLVWLTEPQMLRFKMTLQDVMGAQRVASQRFAVYSTLAISEPTQDVASECLNTSVPKQPVAAKLAATKMPARTKTLAKKPQKSAKLANS